MEIVQINEKNLPKRLKAIKAAIKSAGTKIGNVHFEKRSSGELRKMAYRLHVKAPSTAAAPKPSDDKYKTADKDRDNLQVTVLDCNKVIRDKDGNKIGRGAWRTIPLENVRRVAANGVVYEISS